MEKHLHIICLNVPYPVDYGGVFDLFYKLVALKKQGVKIYLHCFAYGRCEQAVLKDYCEEVYYYKRLGLLKSFSFKLPYIVASRKNNELLIRLAKDEYPILMEGVHCTYLLNDERFAKRKCFVRLHNVEHEYYKNLYYHSDSFLKKIYYWYESKLLHKYENCIAGRAKFWSVIPKDAEAYRKLGCKQIEHLPLFLPDWQVKSSEGNGTFCLFHGDLSVAENEKAARWLLKEVFEDLDIPFVIAGKNPSKKLQAMAERRNGTCVVANPKDYEMQDMIEKAHINVIPSFSNTGIKLKLINALYNGRHCVVNHATVEGTNLESACHVVNERKSFKVIIQKLFQQPYAGSHVAIRHKLLDGMFHNEKNAKQIIDVVWANQ